MQAINDYGYIIIVLPIGIDDVHVRHPIAIVPHYHGDYKDNTNEYRLSHADRYEYPKLRLTMDTTIPSELSDSAPSPAALRFC